MKRKLLLLTLIAALILSAAVLFGCEKKPVETPATTEEITTAEPEPEKNSIVLVEDGKSKVKIIRADELAATDNQITIARNILNAIGDYGDVSLSLGTDWTKDGSHDDEALEILVGKTNYAQTAEVARGLKYTEYSVKVVGNKIVVFGFSDEGVSAAARDLIRLIRRVGDKENKRIEINPEDVSSGGSLNGLVGSIPTYAGGSLPVFYDPGDYCEEIIIPGTTPEEYAAYIDKLKAGGFEVKASNVIGDNSFTTLSGSDMLVNAGYYEYEKSVRVIVEDFKQESLDALGTGTGERVTSAQISMLGLAYIEASGSEKSNGLSILIRLEDGRFIVVDGGFNRVAQANLLVNTIKEQSAAYRDKTGMVIAAWITTHAHGDHMGMSSKQYSVIHNAGIKVENFIVNFMSDTERLRAINYYISKGSGNWSENEGSAWKNVYSAADALGANTVVAHVGQVYRYLGLDVDVLYTIESHGPKIAAALNTTSLIMKFTFTDTLTGKQTTYLSTGDATGDGFEITAKTFGNYLKCDMLQMAHHGGTTWGNDAGTVKAYSLVAPATLVWPCGDAYWPTSAKKTYNLGVQSTASNPNYKETYVAGAEGSVTVFPLPYTVGSGVKTPPKS